MFHELPEGKQGLTGWRMGQDNAKNTEKWQDVATNPLQYYIYMSIIHVIHYVIIYTFNDTHLFLGTAIYLSVYLSIDLSFFLSLSCLLALFISCFLSCFLSFFQLIYLSIYLSIHPSIYLSIYLFVYLSIRPSIVLFQPIYLSMFLPFRLSFFLDPSIHQKCPYCTHGWPSGHKNHGGHLAVRRHPPVQDEPPTKSISNPSLNTSMPDLSHALRPCIARAPSIILKFLLRLSATSSLRHSTSGLNHFPFWSTSFKLVWLSATHISLRRVISMRICNSCRASP
jgi:hypothetical protein